MKLLAVSDGPGYISVLQKMPSLGCFGIFFLFFFFPSREEGAGERPPRFPARVQQHPPIFITGSQTQGKRFLT